MMAPVSHQRCASLFAPLWRERRQAAEPHDGSAQHDSYGLGLHITKEIAARHGGRVFLDETCTPGAASSSSCQRAEPPPELSLGTPHAASAAVG